MQREIQINTIQYKYKARQIYEFKFTYFQTARIVKGSLLNEDTLNSWTYLTLKQRAQLFHRKFPDLQASSSSIQRLYKKHNIRFMLIQMINKVIHLQDTQYIAQFINIIEGLYNAKQQNLKLSSWIKLSNSKNFQIKVSQSEYIGIKINDFALGVKTQALIAAITLTKEIHEYLRSNRTEEFLAFVLLQLSRRFEGKEFHSIHRQSVRLKHKLYKELFKELKLFVPSIFPIFHKLMDSILFPFIE